EAMNEHVSEDAWRALRPAEALGQAANAGEGGRLDRGLTHQGFVPRDLFLQLDLHSLRVESVERVAARGHGRGLLVFEGFLQGVERLSHVRAARDEGTGPHGQR